MSRLNSFWTLLIAYTVLLFLLIPFVSLNVLAFFALGLGYILLIGVFYPRAGLFLFLLTRPILDYFTQKDLLQLLSYEVNLAALWGVAALLLTVYVVYKNRSRFQGTPLFRPWSIFLLVVLVSIPLSTHPALSIREAIRILTIVSFFVLGYLVITENKHFTTFLKVIIFSMLVPGIFAYYQFFTATGLTLPLENIYNRIYGTFAHPNLFAFYLIIPLVLSLIIVIIKDKKKLATFGFGALLATFFGLLVLTYTRGAWIAFLLAIFIIGILRYRRIILVTGLVLILLYTAVPTIQERADRVIKPDPYGSIIWRLQLWEDGLEYAGEKPVLGFGAGTAKEVILKNRGEAKGSPHPHNDYLKILLEYGYVGLAAYLYLLGSVVALLWKIYKQENRPNFKNIYLGIFSLSVALFIMSIGDNMLRNTALQWALWALIGGVLTLPSLKK